MFREIFPIEKAIIGMIHLAGRDREEKVHRALEELSIYDEEGINGAIIEDYHGSKEDVYETLKVIADSIPRFGLVLGVNVLRDPYSGFKFAREFGARFVQFDSVQNNWLNLEKYEKQRKTNKETVVLGGVGFKYTQSTGNPLWEDLEEAKKRCEAIVTTGEGTGIETPIEKLKQYKGLLGNFPLIVGAGVKLENVYEQLQIADGAIVGSYFKLNGNTHSPIERKRVRDLMDVVRDIRK